MVVANHFLDAKIKSEMKRADAIEAQINQGNFSNSERRLELVGNGRMALQISAESLQAGDAAKSNYALQVGKVFLDISLSLNPITAFPKDLAEATTGYNVVTGEKLTTFEHTMAWVGVFTGGVGSKLAIVGKAAVIVGIIRGVKGAEKGTEAAKLAEKAGDVIDSAKNMGLSQSTDLQIALGSRGKLPNFPDIEFKAPNTFLDRHSKLTNGKYTISPEAMKPHTVGSFDTTIHTGSTLPADKSQFFFATDADRVTLDAAAYADKAELWVANKAKVKLDIPIGVHGGTGRITDTVNVYRNNAGTVHASPASP